MRYPGSAWHRQRPRAAAGRSLDQPRLLARRRVAAVVVDRSGGDPRNVKRVHDHLLAEAVDIAVQGEVQVAGNSQEGPEKRERKFVALSARGAGRHSGTI